MNLLPPRPFHAISQALYDKLNKLNVSCTVCRSINIHCMRHESKRAVGAFLLFILFYLYIYIHLEVKKRYIYLLFAP